MVDKLECPTGMDYLVSIGKVLFMTPYQISCASYCVPLKHDGSLIRQLAHERMDKRNDLSAYTGVNGLDVSGS
jgi:hypothetical protein